MGISKYQTSDFRRLQALTNLPACSWQQFNFFISIQHTKSHDFFVFDDTYLIGINNLTGEVDYLDSYTNIIVYKLAPNLDVFLLVLLAIGKYSLKGLLGSTYSNHDRRLQLEKINGILVDKEYLSYYSISYGKEPDLDD